MNKPCLYLTTAAFMCGAIISNLTLPSPDVQAALPKARAPVANYLSPSELDTLARTAWGEVRGQGRGELIAFVDVVYNRVNHKGARYGQDVRGVLLAPKQFSVHNANDPNKAKMRRAHKTDAKRFARIKHDVAQLWNRREAGLRADSTPGCTHYYHPHAMKPAYRVPKWAKGRKARAIGAMRCFRI